MRRFMPLGLVLAGLVVSGCSGGYYADPAQYRQGTTPGGTIAADDPPRRARVASPASELRAAPVRTGPAQGVGTIGDGSQTRPAGGKAESEQAVARETARANDQAKDLFNSICRGC